MDGRIEELVSRARRCEEDRDRAAARLMSLIEDRPDRIGELLACCEDVPGARMILGVTGSPGSGKSTLVDSLISEFRRRYPGDRIGVVAVDPSSTRTGGAVLGDRTRMMRHATDRMVFIRSLASRGMLGGTTQGILGVVRVMSLLDSRTIFVETVGIGQSEIDVKDVVDATAIVLSPGQGDGVQLLKAGVLEIGDLFVINKADQPGADELRRLVVSSLQGKSVVALDEADDDSGDDCGTPVVPVSALEGTGIRELADTLDRMAKSRRTEWACRRREGVSTQIRRAILQQVSSRVTNYLDRDSGPLHPVRRILNGECSMSDVVREIARQLAEESRCDSSATVGGHGARRG